MMQYYVSTEELKVLNNGGGMVMIHNVTHPFPRVGETISIGCSDSSDPTNLKVVVKMVNSVGSLATLVTRILHGPPRK
jgi:hypothetical protein